MWKVCEREKYGYHSLGYVVPRPLADSTKHQLLQLTVVRGVQFS